MAAILILFSLVYGLFQLARFLMSSTVSNAKSHIAESLGPASGEGNERDLITFTKCAASFVFALLLYTVFFN